MVDWLSERAVGWFVCILLLSMSVCGFVPVSGSQSDSVSLRNATHENDS